MKAGRGLCLADGGFSERWQKAGGGSCGMAASALSLQPSAFSIHSGDATAGSGSSGSGSAANLGGRSKGGVGLLTRSGGDVATVQSTHNVDMRLPVVMAMTWISSILRQQGGPLGGSVWMNGEDNIYSLQ